MTRKTLILGAVALALAAGTPAFAQMKSDSMMAGDKMKMSKSQMMAMKKCQGMSHKMMMKNKKCMAMKKMHPDMMGSGKM